MKRHAVHRSIALLFVALLTAAPGRALGGGVGGTVPRPSDGGGVRLELEIRSGDLTGTARVAFGSSPLGMLTPVWMTADAWERARGLMEGLRRGAVLARALGRAALAVAGRQAGARAPGTNGDEGSDADRRRSA